MEIKVFDKQKFKIYTFKTWEGVKNWIRNKVVSNNAQIKKTIHHVPISGGWLMVYNFLKEQKTVTFSPDVGSDDAYIIDIR